MKFVDGANIVLCSNDMDPTARILCEIMFACCNSSCGSLQANVSEYLNNHTDIPDVDVTVEECKYYILIYTYLLSSTTLKILTKFLFFFYKQHMY